MTNYTEVDLYYACMRYCELFTRTLCETSRNQQIKLHFGNTMMMEECMQKEEYLKNRMRDNFYHICEIVEVLKND